MVYRDGRTFEKEVTLKARDQETVATRATERGRKEVKPDRKLPESISFDKIGFTCRNLTSEEKKRLNVKKGVLVSDVKRYSEAHNRQLFENDLILEADRRDVQTVEDLQEIVNEHKPGDSILLRVKSGDTARFVALQIPHGTE